VITSVIVSWDQWLSPLKLLSDPLTQYLMYSLIPLHKTWCTVWSPYTKPDVLSDPLTQKLVFCLISIHKNLMCFLILGHNDCALIQGTKMMSSLISIHRNWCTVWYHDTKTYVLSYYKTQKWWTLWIPDTNTGGLSDSKTNTGGLSDSKTQTLGASLILRHKHWGPLWFPDTNTWVLSGSQTQTLGSSLNPRHKNRCVLGGRVNSGACEGWAVPVSYKTNLYILIFNVYICYH
jgi:hypothetical protein